MASRATLSITPCRLAYCPVTIEARFGEQIGVVWNARSNSAPSRASRSICGVFMYGWPPAPNSSKRRSSISTTRKLGFLVGTSARRLDERNPLRHVVGDDLAEGFRRDRRGQVEPLLAERFDHFRLREDRVDLAVHAIDHRARHFRRTDKAKPRIELI